jgi:16S rRNA G1207 methylase RsmC
MVFFFSSRARKASKSILTDLFTIAARTISGFSRINWRESIIAKQWRKWYNDYMKKIEEPNITVQDGVFWPSHGAQILWECMRENPDIFEGKTVLDIGCGTGILGIYAAKALSVPGMCLGHRQ